MHGTTLFRKILHYFFIIQIIIYIIQIYIIIQIYFAKNANNLEDILGKV